MTVRLIAPLGRLPGYYSASCVRCGVHVADFGNPEYATEAIEAAGGTIVVTAFYVDDLIVACANCEGKCLCPKCGKLLNRGICDFCHDMRETRHDISDILTS